ncbi:nitric oxide detoxifying NorVW flavorubredoxin [Candidatus Scalindua japonica]|uniref:Nitric oxide detoxifying NorVW flavorubredoxin n=1 Tax=Candidatus Scalindua japonica TaxID=1284222 RepID=A0A286TUV8_9BACT|nr:flavin reductase family protein [Candidatus Scalindua japonica]GAX59625.1 nitric oxide detoxifying NorVW flavorubredoxin [Candidatus Scalindua japonica]
MKKSLGAKTLAFPTPAWIVGTYDREGKPNVMTIAWGGICCSKPPCVNISVRKERYSYDNIIEKKAFTINIPSEHYIKEADYFGIATGGKTDKFVDTGLTPVKSDLVDAPYIEEFPLILECKMIHKNEIGIHTQFIGEIVDVKADESVLGEEELPDINKVLPVFFAPVIRTYHGVGKSLGNAFSLGKEIRSLNKKP